MNHKNDLAAKPNQMDPAWSGVGDKNDEQKKKKIRKKKKKTLDS